MNKNQETKAKGTFGERLKKDLSLNWQRYCLAAIVVAYALFILIGIGNFSMPDTYYQFQKRYDESGAQIDHEVVVRLDYNLDASGNPVMLDNVWAYFGSSNMKDSATAQVKFSYGISATTSNWLSAAMGTIKTKDSWNATDSSVDEKTEPAYKKNIYRMYKWTQLFGDLQLPNKSYQYIRITTKNPVYIHELVFRDKNNALMKAEVVYGDAAAAKMFDEQDKFTTKNDRFNSIIFDEYYFARTAFDFLRGDACYKESSHPPLGKIILAAGIGVFGMNTFGMRIMPALFSIATIFIIYAIGKRLFGKNNRSMGVLFALLFAISGINISLGRIGTTDAFLTFFIALSYYYMLVFLQNGIDRNRRLLSFVPLLLSGIFFGFGAAVKWSGITSGIGLFLLFAGFFFVKLFAGVGKVRRLSSGTGEEKAGFLTRVKALWGAKEEDLHTLAGLSAEEAARMGDAELAACEKAAAKKEGKALTADLLLSVLFAGLGFLVFAFAIYLLSYLVAGTSYCALYETDSPLKAFWQNQKYIWSFHTANFGTDSNSSPWWGWPIGYKAACFYTDYSNPNLHVRILCNATLLVYLFSFVSFLYLTQEVVCTICNKNAGGADVSYVKRILRPYVYLMIAFLGCYLPWAFVKRPMYTYTFLPPSIFYVGFLALFLYAALNEWGRFGKILLICALVICGLNFLTSYPSYAGVPLPKIVALIFYGWTNLNPGSFLRPSMGAFRLLSGILR